MRQRTAKFALDLQRADRLSLHRSASRLDPEKTRLIEFGKRAAANRAASKAGKPETFDFLGFTHICGRSRRGGFLLLRHTRRKSMMGKLEEVKEELRRRWHQGIPQQGEWLGQVVREFNQYFGVPTNIRALAAFRYHVSVLWCRALRRRGQKDRTAWDKVERLTEAYLPAACICRPWPTLRRSHALRPEVGAGCQRAITDFAADQPFAASRIKLREHYGFEIGESTIQRITLGHARAMFESGRAQQLSF
nr:hypothetical protein [uncultured Rhodopila sp.]